LKLRLRIPKVAGPKCPLPMAWPTSEIKSNADGSVAALSMGEAAGAVVWGPANAMALSAWVCARGQRRVAAAEALE